MFYTISQDGFQNFSISEFLEGGELWYMISQDQMIPHRLLSSSENRIMALITLAY